MVKDGEFIIQNINKLLEVAEQEVGYLEKETNSRLNDKIANVGSNNWTKYGQDLLKEIGSPYTNGVAWCDMFVDWCFLKAFGKDKAKQLLGGWSAYTPTSAQYFKNMNQWYTSKPVVGDIIFFKNTSRICHTGIVYKVDSTKVYTIEGNTSGTNGLIANGGGVCKKSYLLSYTNIAGYGRPKYDNNTSNNIKTAIDVSSYQDNIDWKRVKRSGINYAILRGVIKNGSLDSTFEKNYSNAIQNGIKIIGVYQFSYALNEDVAKNDAINMIRKLNGKNIDIWLDLEWSKQRKLGKNKVTSIAKTYISTCKELGYKCNIYSNLDWYRNVYDATELKNLGCKFWIARYPAQDTGIIKENLKPNIGEFMWQYSSKGSVDGILGNVDMNIIYGNIESSATLPPSLNTISEESIELLGKINTKSGNLNIRSAPDSTSSIVGTYKKGELVQLIARTSNGWYRTDKGYISGDYVEIAMGKVFNCTKLNVRKEPKVEADNVVSVLNVNDEVYLMKQTDNGWYKVKTKDNLVGYVSNKYITIT